MRNVCSRALVVVLIAIGLASVVGRSWGQTTTVIMDFTNSWRYDQSGRELGTTWRSSTYVEDATWQGPGPGLLGFEDSVPYPYGTYQVLTPLTISGTITNYYFRTTFSFSGTTTGLGLVATNFIDDGAVIYLNGTEVGRFRVPANQNAATFASAGPAAEGQFDVVAITNLSLLRQGNNQLAVEVHQVSATSSDIIWAMKLVSIRATPLSITTQPQSQTVTAGDPVTFSVGVSGGPAFYRWFKDGVAQSSTSNTLTIGSAQLANAGSYFVIVTNSINSVTSMVATLTVLADTTGPVIVDAVGDTNTIPGVPIINVHFSEPLTAATARDTNNYALYAGTNTNTRITITNILYAFTDAPRAFLKVLGTDTNWHFGSNYFLVVNNVADSKGNYIDPNTRVPVSWQVVTNLTQMSDLWFYYDSAFLDSTYPAIYRETVNPWYGTNYVIDFSTGLWGQGPGILFIDPDSQGILCAGDTFGQLISFQNQPTLFRRTFKLATNAPSSATLRLRYIIDDGMVLWLNGVQIHRYNMNPGPYNETSLAINTITAPTCTTNISLAVTNLLPGTNWLAAAVFQSSTPESDTIFGLEMDLVGLRSSPLPKDPPTNQLVLTMTSDGANIHLSWPTGFSGYTLQAKSNLSSSVSWLQVSNQANPYTGTLSGPPRLFRLWNGK